MAGVIDLSMVRRKDGKTVREAMADEPFGFALSFTPHADPGDVRTLVVRWPAFITLVLALLVSMIVAGRI